ncbi:chymotrypsin-like elastase family member 2A [Argiope bruennichi]|uniref:Chymotrypsin-like elastase family member 2A n=1 Tax=Argiope bruennichi TaxID=94029 RepID=A0A8T0ESM9_ARGBR|nr:chymotrypsin-like elastase family member 2A [Argiope bruennichi]KAF8777436.1 Chymotrypsin-like elastase family member 2A [Argiope bruennichi]
MFNKSYIALILYCCLLVKIVVAVSPPQIRNLQCDCGVANERTSKIVGGAVVTPYKYPWMVTVQADSANGLSVCGGALITRQYVLTAAHCLEDHWSVSVGIAVHDLARPGQMIPASEKIIHPNYIGEPFYDVGLIKLSEAVTLSEEVGTLCLPHNVKYEQPGRHAFAAGWGRIRPPTSPKGKDGPVRRFLKEIDLKILQADEWLISAEGITGSGVCNGDSGSPLFTRYEDGRFHVIGVTSIGLKYCSGPSFYPRISALNQWIMSNIMDSAPCETASHQKALNETNYL